MNTKNHYILSTFRKPASTTWRLQSIHTPLPGNSMTH